MTRQCLTAHTGAFPQSVPRAESIVEDACEVEAQGVADAR